MTERERAAADAALEALPTGSARIASKPMVSTAFGIETFEPSESWPLPVYLAPGFAVLPGIEVQGETYLVGYQRDLP